MFKDCIVTALIILAFFAIMFYAVIDGTSSRNWYADKHDAKCEKLAGKTACKCYNRFMAKAGEK
jgi:hypothetical protein